MRSNDRASHGPRARRLGTSIPTVGCRNGCEATAGQAKCQANTAPGLLSPQPGGLKPFVDFCLAVSRRSRPADCFAGYDAAPAARRCGVARSGETAAGIAQHSRLQPSLWEEARRSMPKAWSTIPMGDGTASRQRSAVQKSANALQRPSWDLISASFGAVICGGFR
jgi:hypothetical protein